MRRYAAKADKATQQIVDELRALGFSVTYLGLPVDLAVRKPTWSPGIFMLLEVKSARKKSGDVRLDKRQQKQADYCAEHGIEYVTSTPEALLALGEQVIM